MKPRKLTKEDIDKVRNIEGFPIGTDEDIIAFPMHLIIQLVRIRSLKNSCRSMAQNM